MDESLTTPSANYADQDSREMTFWKGVASFAALTYVVAAMVRVVADPLSATYFYASVFRAAGILTVVGWCVAVFVRKWREARSYAVRG